MTDEICKRLIILAFIFMAALLALHFFGRLLLPSGLPWSRELAGFAMLWMVYLAVAVVFREGSHISITALEESVPRLRRPLATLQKAICLVFMILMGWYGLNGMEYTSFQPSTSFPFPLDWVYLCFPVCAALSILYLLLGILRDFGVREE